MGFKIESYGSVPAKVPEPLTARDVLHYEAHRFVCCADLSVITTRDRRIGELVKEGAFEGINVDKNHLSMTNSLTMDEEVVSRLTFP